MTEANNEIKINVNDIEPKILPKTTKAFFNMNEDFNKVLTFIKKVPVKYYLLLIPIILSIQILYILSSIIDSIPIFSQLIEIIGFYTVINFLVNRALKQKDREQLIKEIKEKSAEYL